MVINSNKSIPKWMHFQLSGDDIELVSQAIRRAEAHTEGEIVPVIVRSSVPASHLGTVCVLSLWLLATAIALIFGSQHHWLILGSVAVILAWLGTWLGATGTVVRLLTPNAEIERLVWQRAQAEFYNEGIGRTKRATGILLFLSINERRAVVLADHAIAAKYHQDTWQEVCDLITKGLRVGKITDGLCLAIERCGVIIQPHFPKVDSASNQLPDRLVIRE